MVACPKLVPLKTDIWLSRSLALVPPPPSVLKSFASLSWLKTGSGMCDPTRNTARRISVKKIFLRSSGIVKTMRIFSHMACLASLAKNSFQQQV